MVLGRVAGLVLIAAGFLVAQHTGYSEGACGGVMKGYDGREYTCDGDRRPVCEQGTGRCVCLARRNCGSKTDEPF